MQNGENKSRGDYDAERMDVRCEKAEQQLLAGSALSINTSLLLVTGSVVIGNQVDSEQDNHPQDHAAGGPGAGQDPLGAVIHEQRAKK